MSAADDLEKIFSTYKDMLNEILLFPGFVDMDLMTAAGKVGYKSPKIPTLFHLRDWIEVTFKVYISIIWNTREKYFEAIIDLPNGSQFRFANYATRDIALKDAIKVVLDSPEILNKD